MKKVLLADVPRFPSLGGTTKLLTGPLELEGFAFNHFTLAPGDLLSTGYHAHHDQAETFYVEEGTVTFETEDGTVELTAGAALRFDPGEFHHAYNAGDARAVVLGFGAPRDSSDVTLVRPCPECDSETEHESTWDESRDEIRLNCLDCGTETGRMT